MLNNTSPTLIRAASVFVIALILSVILATASYIYMDDINQDQLSAKRQMRKWQAKINHSVENNQIIDKYESDFLKLVNQGVVGKEDRLSWFETIQNTAKYLGMPLIKYSLSSQSVLKESDLKHEYKGIDVFKSSMTLDLKMAHEGDLFALLNNLTKADGLYTVDKCNIEKISAESGDTNIKAYCELGWYTFRGKNVNKGKRNAS